MAKVKRSLDVIVPDPYTEEGQKDAVARIMADGWKDEVHMFCRYFRGDRMLVLDWDGGYRVGLYTDAMMDKMLIIAEGNDLEALLQMARGWATTLPPEYTEADLAVLRKYRSVENPREEALHWAGEALVQEAVDRIKASEPTVRVVAPDYTELDRQLHIANEHAEHGGVDECPVCQWEALHQKTAPKLLHIAPAPELTPVEGAPLCPHCKTPLMLAEGELACPNA